MVQNDRIRRRATGCQGYGELFRYPPDAGVKDYAQVKRYRRRKRWLSQPRTRNQVCAAVFFQRRARERLKRWLS
jgi:hypothetical protein